MPTTTQPATASYRTTAQSTRNRRQAAGCYNRPTAAQDAAFKRYMAVGIAGLTAQEIDALASHCYLTVGQRESFKALVQA